MKDELIIFDKKKIEYIQKNYKVNQEPSIQKEKNYINDLREKTSTYKKALEYKELLDEGKINENVIPLEYVEIIKEIYYEEISELKSKINKT